MLVRKALSEPDETRNFDRGRIEMVTLPGATIGRATFTPGWRWSTDVKPVVGTDSCRVAHIAYVVSGRLRVRTDSGEEAELGPGDAHVVGPGHDAWVVGDEDCVTIDFVGADVAAEPGAVTRAVLCPGCGVEFRVRGETGVDHLVAAVQQHAAGSHGQDVSREHILGELVPV